MALITFNRTPKGTITFTSDDPRMYILGKFFAYDIAIMPDFFRAILASPINEYIFMDTCLLEKKDSFIVLTPLSKRNSTSLYLTVIQCEELVERWEVFIFQKLPTQWFSIELSPKQIMHRLKNSHATPSQ